MREYINCTNPHTTLILSITFLPYTLYKSIIMNSIGIITIHKINNYGSVFQAYALQRVCEQLGYRVEIIDYKFPNKYHLDNPYVNKNKVQPSEPRWIKVLFAGALIRQHKGIADFVARHQNLSVSSFRSPNELAQTPPQYDIYITGSDQLWSPRHCNGDPAFMLHFAPDNALKISYAASIGSNSIPEQLHESYRTLLSRYAHISVRESSSVGLIETVVGRPASVVLDPTLLLNKEEWNTIAAQRQLVKKPYILCYFLNYSFNAFPFVEDFAEQIRRFTGYQLVHVARPPHQFNLHNRIYKVGASPEEFLALVRDAELVLTTSFHGTAFAINFGRPVFSIVEDKNAADSRQADLLRKLNLDENIVSVKDCFPKPSIARYDTETEQARLDRLRAESLNFLEKAIRSSTIS